MILEGGIFLEDDPEVLDLGNLFDFCPIRSVVSFLSNVKLSKAYMLGFIWFDDHLMVINPSVDSCQQYF